MTTGTLVYSTAIGVPVAEVVRIYNDYPLEHNTRSVSGTEPSGQLFLKKCTNVSELDREESYQRFDENVEYLEADTLFNFNTNVYNATMKYSRNQPIQWKKENMLRRYSVTEMLQGGVSGSWDCINCTTDVVVGTKVY